jgi:hypothetical protein
MKIRRSPVRSVIRVVSILCAFSFPLGGLSLAAVNPNTVQFNPQPEPPKLLDGIGFAVMSPQHKLYLVRKAGAPGQLAAPGTYKLANGHSVIVGKGGVILDQRSWSAFPNPALFSGKGYYN